MLSSEMSTKTSLTATNVYVATTTLSSTANNRNNNNNSSRQVNNAANNKSIGADEKRSETKKIINSNSNVGNCIGETLTKKLKPSPSSSSSSSITDGKSDRKNSSNAQHVTLADKGGKTTTKNAVDSSATSSASATVTATATATASSSSTSPSSSKFFNIHEKLRELYVYLYLKDIQDSQLNNRVSKII